MQEEKRGFQVWNVLLAVFSFALVLFGNLCHAQRHDPVGCTPTRSPTLGHTFCSAIAVTLVGSFGLLLSRRKALGSPATLETLLSRDGMFFLTLVVLSLLAFSVFIGSVLPTIPEALTARALRGGACLV